MAFLDHVLDFFYHTFNQSYEPWKKFRMLSLWAWPVGEHGRKVRLIDLRYQFNLQIVSSNTRVALLHKFWKSRGTRVDCIAILLQRKKVCVFIPSPKANVLGRDNCIALFDFFFSRLCINVGLINTFTSIAAHLGKKVYFVDQTQFS